MSVHLATVLAVVTAVWGWSPTTTSDSNLQRQQQQQQQQVHHMLFSTPHTATCTRCTSSMTLSSRAPNTDTDMESEAPPLTSSENKDKKVNVVDVDVDDDDEEAEDGEEKLWQDIRGNGTAAVCRICAKSDGEIPISGNVLPDSLVQSDLLAKIDAIYHATTHKETRSLKYINPDKHTGRKQADQSDDDYGEGAKGDDGSDVEDRFDEEEEMRLVSILRSSLENAGFELLDRRDLDLCEALNAGYLLRLSIQPDVKDLDPNVGREFYPELFEPSVANGNENSGGDSAPHVATDASGLTGMSAEDLLFDGRVLVFRRGYSEEVTTGRLLLPKLDYLQASIVQRSASTVTRRLGRIERSVGNKISRILDRTRQLLRAKLSDLADRIPAKRVSTFVKSKWGWKNDTDLAGNITGGKKETKNSILGRYGGSRERFVAAPDLNDAINPFLICEVDYGYESRWGTSSIKTNSSNKAIYDAVNTDIYDAVNTGKITCEYDAKYNQEGELNGPMRLLKRVSISNLVDFFSPQGRRDVIRGYIEKAKLVEPTYEEVVVVWRPLSKKPKKEIAPPKALIEVAEIFGVEDKLPQKIKKRKKDPESKALSPLKIRAFTDVPMANLPAVLPKTRLIFRPADAFVFDTVSLLSFAAVIASQRYDNPKFDLIAIVSVSLWIIRTFFRYSNKLARYDLLVNKFLTSRISHRGPGALKYLASEAASQRATRVGLLYTWLRQHTNGTGFILSRNEILERGSLEMNNLLCCDGLIDIDAVEALNDLEKLGGIRFDERQMVVQLMDEEDFLQALKSKWSNMF